MTGCKNSQEAMYALKWRRGWWLKQWAGMMILLPLKKRSALWPGKVNSYSLGCMLTVLCLVTFFQFWREVSSGKVILPKHSNPKKPVKIMARKRQLSWRVEV